MLIYMKNRNIAQRHEGTGDLTSGRQVAYTDVEFHLDVDEATGDEVVVVAEIKSAKRHVDFLLRSISKFNELGIELEVGGGKGGKGGGKVGGDKSGGGRPSVYG